VDIEEGGYKDWAVDVEPGDANSYPTEDSIEHIYVVVTDKHSGEVYEGKLFLAEAACRPSKPPEQSETPAKVIEARDELVEAREQQEYWNRIKEERSRQLIRELRQSQQERLFKHHGYMKTFSKGDE
jgi:hypothetical protein|tara:strand:+ start:5174 stop:5554 length:381 start_codon:yes stop_codon:yes gene_type:complete